MQRLRRQQAALTLRAATPPAPSRQGQLVLGAGAPGRQRVACVCRTCRGGPGGRPCDPAALVGPGAGGGRPGAGAGLHRRRRHPASNLCAARASANRVGGRRRSGGGGCTGCSGAGRHRRTLSKDQCLRGRAASQTQQHSASWGCFKGSHCCWWCTVSAAATGVGTARLCRPTCRCPLASGGAHSCGPSPAAPGSLWRCSHDARQGRCCIRLAPAGLALAMAALPPPPRAVGG